MRRRDLFVLGAGVTFARPLSAVAQTIGGVRRVGVLVPGPEGVSSMNEYLSGFKQTLTDLGWNDGKNLRLEIRYGGRTTQTIETAAEELVATKPEVILAVFTASLSALQRRAGTIPIVFEGVSDPVAQGFVSNFAHPGGNITGFAQFDFAMGGKWLELLLSLAPETSHVAVMFDPDLSPQNPAYLQSIQSAAPPAIAVVGEVVRTPGDIASAFARLVGQARPGLVVATDTFLVSHAVDVVKLAAQYRIPSVYGLSTFVAPGGLLFYGVDTEDMFRRSAAYVDRILKGTKPGDLPVQSPTKFQLAINLKTAKALGLTVPQSLLVQADQVIE